MGRFRYAWLALAFAISNACDLNPQPEVPSGAGSGGKGGSGATSGSGGSGGSGAKAGSGGIGMGGGGAGGSGGISSGGSAGSVNDGGVFPCGTTVCPTGQVCNSGTCVPDPCAPNPCAVDEACKPNATFTAGDCTGSCASVACGTAERCVDGVCTPTGCKTDCAGNQSCRPIGDGGYECGPNLCLIDSGVSCQPGDVCDPATGSCVVDPCAGVKCPAGQGCSSGECQWLNDAGSSGDAATD